MCVHFFCLKESERQSDMDFRETQWKKPFGHKMSISWNLHVLESHMKVCVLKGATNHVSLRGASYSRYVPVHVYVRDSRFRLVPYRKRKRFYLHFRHSRRAVELKKQWAGGEKWGRNKRRKRVRKKEKTDRTPSPTEVTQHHWKAIKERLNQWKVVGKSRDGFLKK